MAIQVLVVEDEPLVRMGIVFHLSDEGFEVLEAANADQAIALLEQNASIHLVFTDIDMPGSMDGLKLSAFVRKRWPPVRIIVTSGKRLVEATDLPDGSMFFGKPYQLDAVTAAMREMVPEELDVAAAFCAQKEAAPDGLGSPGRAMTTAERSLFASTT